MADAYFLLTMLEIGPNSIAHLVILILASAAIANILINGSIFAGLRAYLASGKKIVILKHDVTQKLITLIRCPMCMGFWCGVGVEFLLNATLLVGLGLIGHLVSLFIAGCIGSISAFKLLK